MTPSSVVGVQLETGSGNSSVGEKKSINPELWQACAGPLVNLPASGAHVVYFPQGHSEQVATSMKKDVDAQIPNYPNLPSKLLCFLHNVTLHADPETDEVYAQMTLQPVPSFDKDALIRSDLSMKANKPPTEFFCKTLTASDTSIHGVFSVPRRAAEKIFPPLDFTMQPPAQELVARDLHDNLWTFRHIYRGQPKRHLLTTGWSLFVSATRLCAGDSVLFMRDEKQQLLLGIRRANRQPANLSSSVLSSDSMHIGILAAAAHAAANNSPFTVFYNPRASRSEFVIPLAKYYRAFCSNQISLGMRFRMMFETEESAARSYMGTITGISDVDPVRWKNSQWLNLQVVWDEPTAGERHNRVSIWEIGPVSASFFICPPPFFRPKRPRQPGILDDDDSDLDNLFKRTMPWLGDNFAMTGQEALRQTLINQILPSNQVQAQLLLAPSMVQSKNVSPNTFEHFDQLQKLPAASEDSICQPLPEFSSSSSANVSQFRKLLRKATYPNKSSSINQLDTNQGEEIQSDQKSFISFGDKFDIHLGLNVVPFSSNHCSGGDMLANCKIPKECQSGLSPGMVSRSFEMPDMILYSTDSSGNDRSFQNPAAWALSLQLPDMHTFTKVYKRGAVPRSIDVTRYLGFEELKLELARVFGIEDQLKDQQTTGWKFFYVNREDDILLFNDEPWEVFVNSVQSIKIFSAPEIGQESLGDDLAKSLGFPSL